MAWTNHKDNHPHISRETWRTRGWLLVRKVERYGKASDNDRRMAMILLSHGRHANSDVHLKPRLESVAYGTQGTAQPAPADPEA